MEVPGAFDQAAGNVQTTRQRSAADLARMSPEKGREAAVEFEGFFIASALESMFSGIETDGLFGGGHGEQVFRSMLLQEYGKSIAERGGIGIADSVQREIIRLQEVQNSDPK
jgi:Rod binding domain-containing protein